MNSAKNVCKSLDDESWRLTTSPLIFSEAAAVVELGSIPSSTKLQTIAMMAKFQKLNCKKSMYTQHSVLSTVGTFI
jgi:hypothetical protein